MNDHNLQTKIYKLICTSPTNIFASADLAQKIMVLFGEVQPKSKTLTAMQAERDLLKRQNTQHIKDMTAQQQRIGRLHEECLEKGGDILHLQGEVAGLKNLNRTAGATNVKKLQGQVDFLIKQRNDVTLERNKAELKQREYKDELVTTYSSIKALKESLLKLRTATTPDLITSEGEKQLFKLLNNSSAKVKRSGRIMNNETARIVSKQIIEDLKEAGANNLFTLVKLRDENHQLKCQLGTQANRAMDQSQKIVELERGMASQAEAFMDGSQRITINPRPARDNPFDGKFDKVTPDSKDERIEKLETHNDNLKAKVRRVVEESSNLEEALIKVARGN